MRASDVMTVGVAHIRPDAPIEEAARLMLRCRISGLPVVDEYGKLVGIVTERDLLRQKGDSNQDRPQWLEFMLGSDAWDARAGTARLLSVSDVMTTDVKSVSEDAPVLDVADLMHRCDIKRVPVIKDGKMVGIISRADLLRGLARQAEYMPSASPEDRDLRQRVIGALAQVPRHGWSSINVIIKHGLVELRGATTDATLRESLVSAAKAVPGVTNVDDRMVVLGSGSGRT